MGGNKRSPELHPLAFRRRHGVSHIGSAGDTPAKTRTHGFPTPVRHQRRRVPYQGCTVCSVIHKEDRSGPHPLTSILFLVSWLSGLESFASSFSHLAGRSLIMACSGIESVGALHGTWWGLLMTCGLNSLGSRDVPRLGRPLRRSAAQALPHWHSLARLSGDTCVGLRAVSPHSSP
jgi:hypothetical protein